MDFLASAAVGLAVGALTGGRPANLAAIQLRAAWLVALALALQLGLYLLPEHTAGLAIRWPAIVTSFTVIGVWLALNVSGHRGALRTGLAVIAVGWSLNALVVFADHGMPVTRSALREVGLGRIPNISNGFLYKHVAAGPNARLAFLSDSIPERFPARAVLSIGDLLLLVGIAAVITAGMRDPARSAPASPVPA